MDKKEIISHHSSPTCRSGSLLMGKDDKIGRQMRIIAPNSRANQLNGKDWLLNSFSIWHDLVKTKEEKALKHPASFPESLIDKLLVSFLNAPNKLVLDPFMGSGTTLISAVKHQHHAIGFEIYEKYIEKANIRLESYEKQYRIINDNAIHMDNYLSPESVDIAITSPPYWIVLNRRRTADAKEIRTYGNNKNDLGNIDDYEEFLTELTNIMRGVHRVLKPKSYCIINVVDIRIKNRLYTFHSDLYTRLETIGLKLDDIIIWDRIRDYNNLKPLGYPYKFRINRVHEYILIFQKEEQ